MTDGNIAGQLADGRLMQDGEQHAAGSRLSLSTESYPGCYSRECDQKFGFQSDSLDSTESSGSCTPGVREG